VRRAQREVSTAGSPANSDIHGLKVPLRIAVNGQPVDIVLAPSSAADISAFCNLLLDLL